MKVRIRTRAHVGSTTTDFEDVIVIEVAVGGELLRITPSNMVRPEGALIDVATRNESALILPRASNAFTIVTGDV